MVESVSFHSVYLKDSVVLFWCRQVIFQLVPLIVSGVQNNCQKQTHFLNSHVRQWGPSFVQCVQVLVMRALLWPLFAWSA